MVETTSVSSSSSWSLDSSNEKAVFQKSPLDTTVAENVSNVFVCELVHPAPLAGMCWLDNDTALDDLFTPACLTTIDINGRITVWTETSNGRELFFEPLSSYQISDLASNIGNLFLKPYSKYCDADMLPVAYSQEVEGSSESQNVATGSEYRAWWDQILRDAANDNDFLCCNMNASGNMMFLNSQHSAFTPSDYVEAYLRRYQYSSSLAKLDANSANPLKPCGHQTGTNASDLGLFNDSQDSLEFLFLLCPESVGTLNTLMVLAVRNVKSQPSAKVGIRICCGKEDLIIPGFHSLSSLICVNVLPTTDIADCIVASDADAIAGISAVGEYKPLGDGVILPACCVTAKAKDDSIVTYVIRPQISIIYPEASSKSTQRDRRSLAVRYVVELLHEVYFPVAGVGILPFNASWYNPQGNGPSDNLPESSQRVHFSRLTCRASLELSGSKTRLLSVVDTITAADKGVDRALIQKSARSADGMSVGTAKVPSQRHDLHWILSSIDPNLGLPSFIRDSLASVLNPQSVCLHHKWNFVRSFIPLKNCDIITHSAVMRGDRYASSVLRKLPALNPRQAWQRLTPYVNSIALDSLGHVLVVYKPGVSEALGLPNQSIIDLSSLTLDRLHVPLIHLVEVPIYEGYDAAYQLFFGVSSGTRKLVAFTLSMDMSNRIVVTPAVLDGKGVFQSLLAAVNSTFHSSSADDSVNSNILNLFVTPTKEPQLVQMVLHLGVCVDGAEEEQVLLTSFRVKSQMSDTNRNSCVLCFENEAVDVYLNYSQTELLGLGSNPVCILDLPHAEDDTSVPFRDYSVQPSETSVSLINSCIRFYSDTAWNEFDLLATYPTLEWPPAEESSPDKWYLPFNVSFVDDASLIVGVYAVINRNRQRQLVPYFLARIPVASSTVPFIMDIILSSRTLAVLCSDARLYIFEFRSSTACRDQHELLSRSSPILAKEKGEQPHTSTINGYIQPHYPVQILDLNDYLTKTCHSMAEDLQIKAARYFTLFDSKDLKSSRITRPTRQNKRRVVTPWQRVANTLRRNSGSGGGGSSRHGTRMEESPNKITAPPSADVIGVRITGRDFGKWLAIDAYSFGNLLSFHSPPCKFPLCKTPEILLVNWPTTNVLPGPSLLSRYQSLITPARTALKQPTTITWLPTPTVQPFIVLSMPVSEGSRPEQSMKCESVNSVASNIFRQAADSSGLIWKALPLYSLVNKEEQRQNPARGSIFRYPQVSDVQQQYRYEDSHKVRVPASSSKLDRVAREFTSHCHIHAAQWSASPDFVVNPEEYQVHALVSYSLPGALHEVIMGEVSLTIPSATSKTLTLDNRNGPGPKHCYHPDVLWSWLRIGNVPIVLYTLRKLMDAACARIEMDSFMRQLVQLPTLQCLVQSESKGMVKAVNRTPNVLRTTENSGERAKDLFSESESDSNGDIFGAGDDEDELPIANLLDEALHGAEPPDSDEPLLVTETDSTPGKEANRELITTEELESLRQKLKLLIRTTQGFENGDLMGWQLILNMSGTEMLRLVGVLDFVMTTKLNEHASRRGLTMDCLTGNSEQKTAHLSWLALYDSLVGREASDQDTSRSAASLSNDALAATLFLCAVARSTFSVGYIGPENLTSELNLLTQRSLSTDEICLGLMVESQSQLLSQAIRLKNKGKHVDPARGMLWSDLKAVGAGFWIENQNLLQQLLDQLPRNEYVAATHAQSSDHDGIDDTQREEKLLENIAVFYCLAGRQATLASLYQKAKNVQVSNFLRNDFKSERFKSSAVKNAWQLIAKKRYMLALAFFVLGDAGHDAIDVAVRYLQDAQLACFIARAMDLNKPRSITSSAKSSAMMHLIERTLKPTADEYQDISLCFFSTALAHSATDAGSYLKRSTAIPSLVGEFENVASTVVKGACSEQVPDASGYILGTDVCLRRFSAFSNCPNVLGCLLPSARSKGSLVQSTLRAASESLNRRYLTFAVALVQFLCNQFPDYISSIPLYIPRMIISQYRALFCSELSLSSFNGMDIRAVLNKWIEGEATLGEAGNQLEKLQRYEEGSFDLFNESMNAILKRLQHEDVAIYNTYPVIGISWLPLFTNHSEFNKLLFLVEILPKPIIYSIIQTITVKKEFLSLSAIYSPVLARLFPTPYNSITSVENVDYTKIRELFQKSSVIGHSVDTLLQVSDTESLIIAILNVLVTVVQSALRHHETVTVQQMRLLICLCLQLTLTHLLQSQYLSPDIFETGSKRHSESLWLFQYSVIVCVLGTLLATFQTMYNVLGGISGFSGPTSEFGPEDDIAQVQMCRGIIRLNTLAATINGKAVSPSAMRSCMTAILLTITQDVILCMRDPTISPDEVSPPTNEMNAATVSALQNVVLQYVFLGSCETILAHFESLSNQRYESALLAAQYTELRQSLYHFCTSRYERHARANLFRVLALMNENEYAFITNRLATSNPWTGIILRTDLRRLVKACDPAVRMSDIIRKMDFGSTPSHTLWDSYALTQLMNSQQPPSQITAAAPSTNVITMCFVDTKFPLGKSGSTVAECLIPHLGSPGIQSAMWNPRAFIPLITLGTSKGLKLINLINSKVTVPDISELLTHPDGRNLELLSPLTNIFMHTLDHPLAYMWSSYLLGFSERQRMKSITRLQESLRLGSQPLDALEFAQPSTTQQTLLAAHPVIGVIAGVLAKPEEVEDTGLVAVIALTSVQMSRHIGDANLIGCLCLPMVDNTNTLTVEAVNTKGRHRGEGSFVGDTPQVTHFTAATVSQSTAGDIVSIEWSNEEIWIATDRGYVIAWHVFPDMTHNSTRNLQVGRALPYLTLHAHSSARIAEPFPYSPGKQIFITAGKGTGCLNTIYTTSSSVAGNGNADHTPHSALAVANNANELGTVNRKLMALCENKLSHMPYFASACREAHGALLVWTNYTGLPTNENIPMLRFSVLFGDFAFGPNDHPTCTAWSPADQSIYYGTVSGSIRKMSCTTGIVQCIVQAQLPNPTGGPGMWPLRLWYCAITSRLITIWSDGQLIVFDVCAKYTSTQSLDFNSRAYNGSVPLSVLPVLSSQELWETTPTLKTHAWQKKQVSIINAAYVCPNYVYTLTSNGVIGRTLI